MKNQSVPENLKILFEDNHLIAVNKRAGDIVQGDKTGDIPLTDILKMYLKEKYHKPGNVFLGLIHRLDRPVSGAVIFAKTGKSLQRMNELFQKQAVEKIYWGIVKNKPPKTTNHLIHYLIKNASKNKVYVSETAQEKSLKAELSYEIISASEHYYLLKINLFTGRPHQIRAQLAHIGCPLKGDLKYGFSRSNPDASINLHAREISFVHPVQKKGIKLIAPVPDENLWKYFESNQS